MTGEKDLVRLHATMCPRLHPDTFIYCTFDDFALPAGLDPVCTMREDEGLTAIVPQAAAARAGVSGSFPSRMITLAVHSSLEAIGFMASVAVALAKAGIPCNAVAGYYHDHLFVPEGDSERALHLLLDLAATARGPTVQQDRLASGRDASAVTGPV